MLGATFGYLLDWGYFELVREISIMELLTLIVTVGCAIYITGVLEKGVEESRVEKELHLSEITELSSLLRSIETLFEDPPLAFKRIEVRISACNNRAIGILSEIRATFGDRVSSEMELFDAQIVGRLIYLKGLLTRTTKNHEQETEDGIIVECNVVTYSPDRLAEITATFNAIVGSLFRLKICINHL
jgi:hypothetical protein